MPRRSGDRPRRMKVATISVHAGTPEGPNAPITTPVVQSTTFRFESAEAVQRYARGEGGLYMYSRDENPTVRGAAVPVRVADQSDVARPGHRCGGADSPRRRRDLVDRFHIRAPGRAAAARLRRRSRDAFR